jgi:hypothetical protein
MDMERRSSNRRIIPNEFCLIVFDRSSVCFPGGRAWNGHYFALCPYLDCRYVVIANDEFMIRVICSLFALVLPVSPTT